MGSQLFDPGSALPPGYRTPSRSNAKAADHRRMIAEGMHPLTRGPLGRRAADGQTCGTCVHSIKVTQMAQERLKCELRDTRSAATDIRLWWPACTTWQAPDG